MLAPASEIARHYHARPYATVVLSGAYEEAGDAGRWRVEAGDVLLHAPFSAHRDLIAKRRTQVLDLPLPLDDREWPGRGRVADPELLLRIAQRDTAEAASLLLTMFEPVSSATYDTRDLLAAALTTGAAPNVAEWAKRHGLARETVSRHFSAVYGVAPARYRAEARARRAWRMIVGGEIALADIAVDAGYADQAHMTRGVKILTGHSPGHWRQWRRNGSHSFNT